MKIEFHPRAEEEFIEAASYYEQRVSSLGRAFITELESALALLEEHPELGVEFESPFRRHPMRRFPHSLIYAIEASRIWIVAVAHQRRRPDYWLERVE